MGLFGAGPLSSGGPQQDAESWLCFVCENTLFLDFSWCPLVFKGPDRSELPKNVVPEVVRSLTPFHWRAVLWKCHRTSKD